MKKHLLLLIIGLSINFFSQAQITRTVQITPGGLYGWVTSITNNTTNLILKGTMDARDFRVLRDKFPYLSTLDISEVKIVAYSGDLGPNYPYSGTYKANSIPEYSFRNTNGIGKTSLNDIKLPTSVTSIGVGAFTGCSGLKSLTIPSAVDSIRPEAFARCAGLTSLNLPSSILYLGPDAFALCNGLTSVTIPNSFTSIGSAFGGCTGLKQVNLPETLTTIEYGAFRGCTGLTSIQIPQSVTGIHGYAFANCTGLTSVTIPSKLTSIGEFIFSNCTNLTSISILSPTMNTNNGLFNNCAQVTSLTVSWLIPPPLGYYHFNMLERNNCTVHVPYGTAPKYKEHTEWNQFKAIVEFPTGIYVNATSAGVLAYAGSTATVNITANVAWTATSDQTWLEVSQGAGTESAKLTFTAQANPSISKRTATVTVSSPDYGSRTITITQNGADASLSDLTAGGLMTAFSTDELESITRLTLKGTIDARDFRIMRDKMPLLAELDLSEVTIAAFDGLYGTNESYNTRYPANTIPEYAFCTTTYTGKTSLSSVIFPSTLTGFGKLSFNACSNLKSLTIPSSVTTINYDAFRGCRNLKSLTIPSSVTTIGDEAFLGCSGVTTLDLPSSILSIGVGAFSDCTGLTSVDIPSSISVIKTSTFSNCTGLTSVNIPPTITSIADFAFNNCTGLTSINLPNGLTRIGSAFTKCTGLTNITIPESVTTLDYSAFKECSGLTSVIIPESVTTISGYAFSYCEKLTSVTILSKKVSISDAAFFKCDNLSTVSILSTSVSIGSCVFQTSSNMTSLTLGCTDPPTYGYYSFNQVDRNRCILNVPYGTSSLYAASIHWKDFINRREMPGFYIPANVVSLESAQGTSSLDIKSNVEWTATSDQTWLIVSPTSGTGMEKKLTFTAEANPFHKTRTAKVSITSPGIISQTVTITQLPSPTKLELTAGRLSSTLTDEELKTITDLIITGTIDARDFKTMRDKMPLLVNVNLREASIAAYTGNEGTYLWNTTYPANTIPTNAFYNSSYYNVTSPLTAIILPQSITSIGVQAFYNCSELTSVTIPLSVTTLGSYSFGLCRKLTSITVEGFNPPNLNYSSEVFNQVNKSTCILNVPYQSAIYYRSAYQWKDFLNITEAPNGFRINANNATVNGTEGSTATIDIASNIEWTASSDKDWLVVNPTSGNGASSVLTFTAHANPSFINTRTANITLSAPGVTAQNIIVVQSVHPQSPKIWEATPGGLETAFTAEELLSIQDLTLTGAIDARDFKTMRDKMPKLAKVNISGATIVAYNGPEGTKSEIIDYPAHAIPPYAFRHPTSGGKTTLTSISLPESLTTIGANSFSQCQLLTNVIIPPSVTDIGNYAFNFCRNIAEITIPSAVTNIGFRALESLNGRILVEEGNSNYMAVNNVLFNKAQSQLIQCSNANRGNYIIPLTVTTIGDYAFNGCGYLQTISIPSSVVSIGKYALSGCTGLQTIIIPPSVTSIGEYAFSNCYNLNSIFVNSTAPVDLSTSANVFRYVDPSRCKLYVPIGSKAVYQAANQWMNFLNIIEVNMYMIADAGPDKNVNEGTLVSLEGSFLINKDGNPLSYQWTAPAGITLSSTTETNPTFTAPEVSYSAILTFSLVISDGVNTSTADQVNIQVTNVNKPPVANAGADQSVNENSVVLLDGIASSDPDNGYIAYQWIAPAGIFISSINGSVLTFNAPEVTADTNYTFYLWVNDGQYSKTDTVAVTVRQVNKIPIAHPGDYQHKDEGSLVTLDGTASFDPDGETLTYLWTAPSGITLSSSTVAMPTFTAPEVNTNTPLTFKLVVNDGKLNSAATEVTVMIRNILPVLKLIASAKNLEGPAFINYQLFMKEENSFIQKIDTFAVTDEMLYLGLEPGDWIVLASPAREALAFLPTYAGNVLNWKDAEVISMPDKYITYREITCINREAVNPGLGQISGFVYEKPTSGTKSISLIRESLTNSTPIQQALVRLFRKGSTIPVASVFTDSQGAYKFEKLGITDYEIAIDIPGYVQSDKFTIGLSAKVHAENAYFGVDTYSQVITDNNLEQVASINVYPNPTTGIMNIVGLQGYQKSRISIYSMDGRPVMEKVIQSAAETIDISNQVSGIYILVINNQRFKVIKR